MFDFFAQEIEYLKGVGPARANILRSEAKVRTYGDLLNYFPFRYVEKGDFVGIGQIHDDRNPVAIKGKIKSVSEVGFGRNKRLVAQMCDETGCIELTWFSGLKWISQQIKPHVQLTAYGKPVVFNHRLGINHPEIEILDASKPIQESGPAIQPVYPTTETMKNKGLTPKALAAITRNLCQQARQSIPEILSPEIVTRYRLLSREESYRQVHHPDSLAFAECARQ
ncbi:MAG: ATP-dependent DNA helicase RecG, partial [Bacteroidales bacterium]|nr:ATP-dependent DNA helicase RecG [Bacteroidales bacterium]